MIGMYCVVMFIEHLVIFCNYVPGEEGTSIIVLSSMIYRVAKSRCNNYKYVVWGAFYFLSLFIKRDIRDFGIISSLNVRKNSWVKNIWATVIGMERGFLNNLYSIRYCI